MDGRSILRSSLPSGRFQSIEGIDCLECFLGGCSSGCGDRYYRRIRQLTTPVDNSLADAPEVVTVRDPTHPLYGRRLLVASRPTRPDAQGTHLLVFLRETVQLRLPLRVTLPVSTAQTVTKLTLDAVADVIATAHACGIWQSDPQPCGDSSPTTLKRPSCPISKPLSAR
jgi:hypothetical protein